MIAIVNYGLGNVQAIANIYKRLGVPASLATTAADLNAADRVILPGVGSFDWAMMRLNASGMRGALEDCVRTNGKPILGICVGMQMMACKSEEGKLAGLGWIEGIVKKFDVSRFSDKTHLPHMGWNDVETRTSTDLFKDLDSEARFYFLHSYYFSPDNEDNVLAETDYHGVFASSVRSANVYGVQFHPEKSHRWGIRLLSNFADT
jgi:imidazole glycerol-phosphate synthase subunit HisH